jgi:hypothetical protein
VRDPNPIVLLRALVPPLAVAAFALAGAANALAQAERPSAGTTTAPARVGNIYDYKAHQPNEADICGGKRGTSVNCPSASEKQQVEEEVQRLLRQSGADVQAKQRELKTPR